MNATGHQSWDTDQLLFKNAKSDINITGFNN